MSGRQAFYSVALDGSMKEELIFARPDVDVDGVVRIGRRNRVVGVSYVTDVRQTVYFDPDLKALATSLGKALPNQPLVRIVDSTTDESKLLLIAASDVDPGTYYVLDRKTKQMRPLMAIREEVAEMPLGKVRPITYPATDGTMVPGYLTLPPGKESAKGLPAIVLPHGGPGARDEWGFDWLSQFYAARGFAVLQPNFRGSTGLRRRVVPAERLPIVAGGDRRRAGCRPLAGEAGHCRSGEAGRRRLVLWRLCRAAIRGGRSGPVQGGDRDCSR
jgi:dipeptidyl aminopeptidase/acylaminoacyl peptidase